MGSEAICTFMQQWSQEGEKPGFIYAWAEYYLQPNTLGRHCAWADHYLSAAICRSHGGLSANEKEQKFALNDIHVWHTMHVYATTALSLRINSCLQGRVDLMLDKYM